MIKNKKLPLIFIKGKKFPYLFLFSVGLLIYLNSFFNYFLWDDELLIVKNGYIRSWTNIFKVFLVDIFHWTNKSNFYRPLFTLSLMFDYSFWRLEAFGYHLTNFFLHLSNSFLIFYLLRFLRQNKRISLITALLFLVHPVHTEAVTYISGRADPLAVLFSLLTFLFFIKSLSPERIKYIFFYFLSLFFYTCALLSKEIALALPLFLLTYDFLFSPPRKNLLSILKKLYKHLAFLLITLAYIGLRINLFGFASKGAVPYSLPLRVINLPHVYAFYIYILILPFNLRVERFLPLIEKMDAGFFLYAFLLIAVIFWAAKSYRRSKLIFFFSLWFFINIFIVANIVMPLNAVVAEHWSYLASIGFFYIAACGFDKFLRPRFVFLKWAPTLKFRRSLFVIIVTTLCLLTISRNFQWKSPVIFFESTLRASEGQFSIRDTRVRYNLANAYASRGDLDKAIQEFKRVLEERPDITRVYYSLGLTYARKGLYEEAENKLLKTIELDPGYLQAYYTLGSLYLKQGDRQKAKLVWKKALEIEPRFPREKELLEQLKVLKSRISSQTIEEEGILFKND
ncbi:MAG: hypothetical protein DRP74_03205 [Candidatus Omnitrophota bacterium]|nr:MAG: hypothetical protein DRP74_03205 [Candidatus Omnitrophota bacterium]